jgi:hypothetical protein
MEGQSTLISKLGSMDLVSSPDERRIDKSPAVLQSGSRGPYGTSPTSSNEGSKTLTPKRGLRAPRGLNLQMPARSDALSDGAVYTVGGHEQVPAQDQTSARVVHDESIAQSRQPPHQMLSNLPQAALGNLQTPANGAANLGLRLGVAVGGTPIQRPPASAGRAGTSLSARKKAPGKLTLTMGLGNLNGDMQQQQQKKEFSL